MSKEKKKYFSHDAGARNDDNMMEIRYKYGWWGYGIFFAILEILRESDDYKLKSNNAANKISMNLNEDKDKIYELIADLKKHDMLIEDDEYLYSKSLLDRMKKMKDVSKERSKASRKRWDKEKTDSNKELNPNTSFDNTKQKEPLHF